MTPRRPFRLALLSMVLVALSTSAQMPPAKKDTTAEQKELLAEAQKCGKETEALREPGKPEEAITAAQKMLAAEVKLYGELHEDPIGSLKQIAEMQEQLEKFDDAGKTRRRLLEVRTKRFGKDAWQVRV